MAEARLIFRNNIEKKIDNIIIDSFTQENYIYSNTVTKYPVEKDSDISDHIQNDPDSFNAVCVIEPIDDGSNIISNFKLLNDLSKSKKLITVVAGLKVFKNMVMSNLNFNRNAKNGGSLVFTVSFENLRIVSSQAVTIPDSILSSSDDETKKQASSNKDQGKVTSNQNEEEEFNFLAQVDAQVDQIFAGF